MSWACDDARSGVRQPVEPKVIGMENTTLTRTAVQLTGLTKRFGSVTAVDNLSLTIEPGEVVAFLGPNGAGKTTTVDMMLGLARPTAGSVEIYGDAPTAAGARGRIAAVMQTGGLLKDISV